MPFSFLYPFIFLSLPSFFYFCPFKGPKEGLKVDWNHGLGSSSLTPISQIQTYIVYRWDRCYLCLPSKWRIFGKSVERSGVCQQSLFCRYVFTFTYSILVWQEAFWKTDNLVKLEQNIIVKPLKYNRRNVKLLHVNPWFSLLSPKVN